MPADDAEQVELPPLNPYIPTNLQLVSNSHDSHPRKVPLSGGAAPVLSGYRSLGWAALLATCTLTPRLGSPVLPSS